MKTTLNEKEILGIDIEPTGYCNLKCPLCLSQMKETKHLIEPHLIDIDLLIEQLNKMEKLNLVSIAGDASEPTLHPRIKDLLEYLKNREGIFVEFYTNAQLYDDDYWTELNKHFNKNSRIYFTICGTTQELHEKYRVGSKLNTVLSHALAFRKNNPNENDYLQYIRFEYNKNDDKKEIQRLFSMFSDSGFVETDPIYERFHIDKNKSETDVCSERMFSMFYKMHLKNILKKDRYDIECHSLKEKYVRVDNNMIFSPCVCYRIYNKQNFMKDGNMDYSKILDNEYDFCYECDKEMVKFMEKNNRDSFYIC